MDENVKFVPKDNVPQARLIENFWGVFGTKSLRGRLGVRIKKFVESHLERVKAKIKSKGYNVIIYHSNSFF